MKQINDFQWTKQELNVSKSVFVKINKSLNVQIRNWGRGNAFFLKILDLSWGGCSMQKAESGKSPANLLGGQPTNHRYTARTHLRTTAAKPTPAQVLGLTGGLDVSSAVPGI